MFTEPVRGRTAAAAEGEVVVLLAGMRINHFRAVHQWPAVALSMIRMLRELRRAPGRGLLGHVLLTASPRTYHVVRYGESREKLSAYAASPDVFHHRVWSIATRRERAGAVRGRVGLWHETYVAPEGAYESVYFEMPPFGLAAAHGQVPLAARGRSAKDRFAHRSRAATR